MQQISVATHHRPAHAISLGVFAEVFQGIQSLAKGACLTPLFVLGYPLSVCQKGQKRISHSQEGMMPAEP